MYGIIFKWIRPRAPKIKYPPMIWNSLYLGLVKMMYISAHVSLQTIIRPTTLKNGMMS